MFEKEADKYVKAFTDRSHIWSNDKLMQLQLREAYKDGAEFGYNKAKEEMQEQGLALQSDMDKTIEQNIALKKELNKANEWHYVKDGDLPKKTNEYLVYRISGYGSKSIELIQYNSSRHFWCVDCQNEVIAWKEIELPEGE